MSKEILITGGCGFKGSVLTSELIKDGHEVTIVDNQWFGNYLKKHTFTQYTEVISVTALMWSHAC